jgi:hypothetical protein
LKIAQIAGMNSLEIRIKAADSHAEWGDLGYDETKSSFGQSILLRSACLSLKLVHINATDIRYGEDLHDLQDLHVWD